MMWLPDFAYHRVESVSEAVGLLSDHGDEAAIIAGGTDLLLRLKENNRSGRPCPKHLVSLKGIKGLNVLRLNDGNMQIGANVTHRQAELSSLVKEELGALHDAIRNLASVQIRNTATIAGNICNAVPCADTAAPLLALDAEVSLAGPRGERRIPIREFWTGPGSTVLEPGELLIEIDIPQPPSRAASAYMSVTHRKAMDIATVGVAAYLECNREKSTVQIGRIALNTVAPTPVRAYEAEALLKGAPIREDLFQEAALTASEHSNPRTSFRSTAEYRREMVRVLVHRALTMALSRLRERRA